jgi:predicted Holliday junction resolvase-like endonuclease
MLIIFILFVVIIILLLILLKQRYKKVEPTYNDQTELVEMNFKLSDFRKWVDNNERY